MIYNILDYGAIADGVTVTSAAIQAAIDACSENGGGRVLVPAGKFVTGTLWLKSHVELHLEQGAELIASTDLADYNENDAYPQNFWSKEEEWNGKHLVIAHEITDVSITGYGTINGSGDAFFDDPHPIFYYCWDEGIQVARDKVNLRPGQLICFIESSHIRVEGITIRNSPCWCCFFHGCDYVGVRGIKVFNAHTAGNTDGIDIDSSSHVTVSDSIIDTGDDAIAVRCNPGKLKNNTKVCEYITITNCVCSAYSAGVRIGVGNGLLRYLSISNMVFSHAANLINLGLSYNNNSASNLEHISISNIRADYTNRVVTIHGKKGTLRDLVMENVIANATAGCDLIAPENGFARELIFRNIKIHYKNKYTPEEMTDAILAERKSILFHVKGVPGLELQSVKLTMEPGEEATWQGRVVVEDCPDAILQDVR